MAALPNPRLDHLLSVLLPTEWEKIAPQLTRADPPFGHVVYESSDHPGYVCFPVTPIVFLLYVVENNSSGEIIIVGSKDMVGITIFTNGETTPGRAVVQNAGGAYHLSARILEQEFTRAGAIQRLLLRYTQALITQMAQTVVCNRHHSIDQQLCHWLLLSLNHLSPNELYVIQELIANMLGVRRSGITEATSKLQTAGLICYSHGTIEVLDRPGLERRVYECYTVVKREFGCPLPSLEAP